MNVTGKNGIGNYLKIFLQICLYGGVILLVSLPFTLKGMGLNMNASTFVIYPNGIVLLLIVYKFIKLFDSLKINQPFCDSNVNILKSTGIIALVEACLWLLDLVFQVVLVKSDDIVFNIVLAFLFVLFVGVSIALYILSELFKEAVNYKKENELTI